MKKTVCMFLALFVLAAAVFIPNGSTGNAASLEVWETRFYPDLFNDPTDEPYLINIQRFSGAYNTEGAKNGELGAELMIDASSVSVILYRDGNEKMKNASGSPIRFVITIMDSNGGIHSSYGLMPNSGERIELDREMIPVIVSVLSQAGEAEFRLEQENRPANTFVFTAIGGNFGSLYEAEIASAGRDSVTRSALRHIGNGLVHAVKDALGAAPETSDNAEDMEEAEKAGEAIEMQTLTASAPGVFGEPVEVEVVADTNTIYSVTVTSHNETMGIGSLAVDRLPGRIVEAQSVEVDGVAGATMTSSAIKKAVAECLEQVNFGSAPEEPAVVEAGEAQTLTASAPGVFGEPVEVEVVADAGTIYSVTVTKNNETPGIGSIAVEQLPGKIVEAQSVEVDGVAGATMTSRAIKQAVAECLEQVNFGSAPEEPAAATTGEAQILTASVPGVFGEPVEIEVVADAGTIYSVTVTSHNETPGIGSLAVEQLPGRIVEAQSVEVDGVAGATMTSNAIKKAVAECLEKIGFGRA